MPPAVALAVSATIGVAGAAHSVIQGERAQRAAKRAGRERATQIRKEADVERERNRRLLASQRAAYGAAGVGLQGSPVLVQAQTLVDSILDRERILTGAAFAEGDARRQGRAFQQEGFANAISQIGGVGQLLASPEWQSAFAPATTPASTTPTLPRGVRFGV